MKLPKLTRKPKHLDIVEAARSSQEETEKISKGCCRNCKFPKIPDRMVPVITGLVIMIGSYFVVVLPMNLTWEKALLLSFLISLGFTTLLNYSRGFRCLVCLITAQMCSKRGRTVIVAYTYVLIMTGPSVNTTKNIYVTAKTMSCGQVNTRWLVFCFKAISIFFKQKDQLQKVMGGILNIMKSPFVSLKESFKEALKVIKEVLVKVKDIMVDIYKSCKEVCKYQLKRPWKISSPSLSTFAQKQWKQLGKPLPGWEALLTSAIKRLEPLTKDALACSMMLKQTACKGIAGIVISVGWPKSCDSFVMQCDSSIWYAR